MSTSITPADIFNADKWNDTNKIINLRGDYCGESWFSKSADLYRDGVLDLFQVLMRTLKNIKQIYVYIYNSNLKLYYLYVYILVEINSTLVYKLVNLQSLWFGGRPVLFITYNTVCWKKYSRYIVSIRHSPFAVRPRDSTYVCHYGNQFWRNDVLARCSFPVPCSFSFRFIFKLKFPNCRCFCRYPGISPAALSDLFYSILFYFIF